VDLNLTDPDGTVTTPAPSSPDTTAFTAQQDRMRALANGESEPPAVPAPPRRATPDAQAEKPKRTRSPRKDAARTTSDVKPATPDKAAADVDYSDGAKSLVQSVWLGTAVIPFTQPYAAVLYGSADGLADALAEGAKHNETIRGWVSKSDDLWQLKLAGVAIGMGVQCFQVARDPKLREQARAATQKQLKETLKAQGIEIPEKAPAPPESADAPTS
jgi:hypothetical protein